MTEYNNNNTTMDNDRESVQKIKRKQIKNTRNILRVHYLENKNLQLITEFGSTGIFKTFYFYKSNG